MIATVSAAMAHYYVLLNANLEMLLAPAYYLS